MSGADFDAIKADIQAHGLNQPITVLDGLILDGGNRYRACIELGIEPATVAFSGSDPVAFVLSANLHRRHLSAGQSAAIVAAAQDWTTAQGHGGDRKSDQAAILPLANIADRAAQSGAGERTQRMADKVAKADPALARQVAHGEKTLPQAVEEITGKRPGAKFPKHVDQPETYDPSEDEAAELAQTVRTLAAENDALKDRLAVEVMAVSEEEKTAAIDTIESLRAEVKQLEIALSAVTASRDSYQRENAELKIQLKRQRKQLDRVGAA